jgi:hypothetical protein
MQPPKPFILWIYFVQILGTLFNMPVPMEKNSSKKKNENTFKKENMSCKQSLYLVKATSL